MELVGDAGQSHGLVIRLYIIEHRYKAVIVTAAVRADRGKLVDGYTECMDRGFDDIFVFAGAPVHAVFVHDPEVSHGV